MMNEDQATFVFMNPKSNQEQLLQERDMVKEVLQQALVRHRQLVKFNCSRLFFHIRYLKKQPKAMQIKIKRKK